MISLQINNIYATKDAAQFNLAPALMISKPTSAMIKPHNFSNKLAQDLGC